MAYGASLLVIDLFRLLLGNESGSINADEEKKKKKQNKFVNNTSFNNVIGNLFARDFV